MSSSQGGKSLTAFFAFSIPHLINPLVYPPSGYLLPISKPERVTTSSIYINPLPTWRGIIFNYSSCLHPRHQLTGSTDRVGLNKSHTF
jgi:hypothetical protein